MKDPRTSSNLSEALRACRGGFVSIAVFSMFANLLMLTGPLFMLQIYDRVLASSSVSTLLALCLLATALLAFYGFLEFIRSRLLVRIGRFIDEQLRGPIFDKVIEQAFRKGVRVEALSDLQTVRNFIQGSGPLAILDMPWMPIYLGIIFMMSTWLGYLALIAGVALALIAVATEAITRNLSARSHAASFKAGIVADQCRNNVDTAMVLGMVGPLRQKWTVTQDEALEAHMVASDRSGMLGGLSRTLRLFFQSAVLALGAYLVIQREVSPGVMIASSIIMSRALAPIEMAVGQWPQFQAFCRSWSRLRALFADSCTVGERLALPKPSGRIEVTNLSAFIPGAERPLFSGVSFSLEAGEGLGIIGPTGAGKSTLARALVGAWPATRGSVRLDGATLDQWHPEELGKSLGYLPQESEFFEGTIADNIARFSRQAEHDAVVSAAKYAYVHDLILGLPQGYNTVIGPGGRRLSAGERQRLGLARALYGNPTLIVLDEPNANLDSQGEVALVNAISAARDRGATVIIVAHRPSAISSLSKVMVLKDGQVAAFGPKDEVLNKVLARPVEVGARPGGLSVVA